MRNEKYKGDALLQKVDTSDFLNKTHKKNNGVLPQYYVTNSHPAIIDAETFDLVQQEFEKRGGSDRGRRSGSVFDRKVICGSCGHFYGQRLWQSTEKGRVYVWRCTHKYDSAPYCQTPVVREDKLKNAFIKALNQILSDRDAYIAELEQILTKSKGRKIAQIRQYIDDLRNQPQLVTGFKDDAFKALAEKITVAENGDMTVRFKDGKEITVVKPEEKKKGRK